MTCAGLCSAVRKLFRDTPGTAALWGDGFADDAFAQIANVGSWDLVSSDEYLRLYPRLVGVPQSLLLDYMERGVATLFIQSRARGARPLLSIGTKHAEVLASAHAVGWSPAPAKTYLDGLVWKDLALVDGVLTQLSAGITPHYDAAVAEAVAFHIGIHPAYLWPEAMSGHQRLTTLGWLGVVLRGRAALMPFDVAEYLHESLTDPEGDHGLTNRMGSRRSIAKYLRQASRRLQGREVISSSHGPRLRNLSFAVPAP